MSANARSTDLASGSERVQQRAGNDRRRIFRPNYLSFAGTYQCNLSCPHCCVPIEWTDRLDIPTAVRFLEQSAKIGIRTLGFTGGEPFLYPEFVHALTQRGIALRLRFDKIMTNGVWFTDQAQLESVLQPLAEMGFPGKIGLSIDKFHGIHTAKLAQFCRTVRRIFDRDAILSLSYASRRPDAGLEPIRSLAKELNAVVEWSDLLGRYLLVSDDFTMTLNWNHLATVERAESLPGDPWDGTWFEEDYCEGPGQAFIVNPKGEVKPCCGFASDLDQLSIGNIYEHSAEEILSLGRAHPYVGKVFREGLLAIRDSIVAENPDAFPKGTSNHCYFCWYVLTRGLVKDLPGGGGQVGAWTGLRPNATGELVQLGVLKRTAESIG
ncbi:radical SAM protein [Tuwongella immobilis]|uniref:Radical SAM core domain-containing protein n=1 Tax=Tuwongella immobilis TaxID=692036 RepID=A0A6C2YSC3_9BACT|nr:radical SAM protein [Tuwongella immobilis]VIP03875.1 radical sam additional 4fe4s-binding spasm domain protein : Radical SAM superfamily protein OS=Treponema sp. JC4 GN=MSI_23190 PE=4 SV=1: Radical_SAM: Fer4_12: SPASM [Tuwongella immobilis]VTS05117.1 radical sam additional 4fe4s-binding spasm domain protein : Radical SAM superfamily protein OS=Treponema sp. JC4 GN=MSI_23190 PE=4 SV=1: Radical_SAM: Fer4_12: SPASM [Tuwongella immobilis]